MERSPRYVFQQDVKQYVWYACTCVNKKEMCISWYIHKIFLYTRIYIKRFAMYTPKTTINCS